VGRWVLFDYRGVLCTTQPEPDRLALLTAAGVPLCRADLGLPGVDKSYVGKHR
jgi:hypothetical protein